MSIPKEPRQLMINIMYLVLIAMLALSISNEIVNAFKTLDDGVNASNSAIDAKMTDTFSSFQAAVDKNKDGQIYLDKANQAKTLADGFVAYVDGIKAELIEKAGGEVDEDGWPINLTDQDTPTRYMVLEGKGDELEQKIKEAGTKFEGLFDGYTGAEENKASFSNFNMMKTSEVPSDSKKNTWAEFTFDQMPMVSVLTLLDQYKNSAKNTASAAVDALKNNVSKEEVIFDKLKAVIVPLSGTKLIQGDKFEAEVFLSSSASSSRPSISVNGQSLSVTDGSGKYTASTNSLGEKTINAKITSKDGFGKSVTRDASLKYTVVPPPDHVPVVSPNKMNVFYIGVDNPVTCAITGIADSKVNASISNGTISRSGGGGTYNVRVTQQGNATVTLSGPSYDGSNFSGSNEFRVKRIPDPVVMLGKEKPGVMASGAFKAQQGLRAVLEDFDFDARFDVVAFEITLASKGADLQIAPNNGAKFSGRAADIIRNAKPNDIVFFDKIRAKGPDGSTRDLGSVSYKIL